MGKIIINYDCDDLSAVHRVLRVIKKGKISEDGGHYGFATKFSDGTKVFTDVTRKGANVFHVFTSPTYFDSTSPPDPTPSDCSK